VPGEAASTGCESARRGLRRARLHLVCAAVALCAATGAVGDEAHGAAATDPQSELAALRERIEVLSEDVARARDRGDRLEAELAANDARLNLLTEDLHGIERELEASRAELAALADERTGRLEALAAKRKRLAREVRTAYALDRVQALGVLLEQDRPATLSRALSYHAYVQRRRVRQIERLAADLSELERLTRGIAARRGALARLQREHARARRALETERAERSRLLAELAGRLRTGDAELARLRRDAQGLEALVTGLREEAGEAALAPATVEPFPARRGHLPWPADGPLLARFGSPRDTGGVSWQGVLIGAERGDPVHAVSHGRVAFADWLRGFGLLLIVDHGEGYMSLYGRNGSLFKEVGDWVAAGELVANVGEDGGVYFEIRENGVPTDPLAWCRAAKASGGRLLVTR